VGRVHGLVAWVVLPIALALGSTPRAEAAEPKLKIGLPETMFHGVPTGIAQTVAQPFQSIFEKQSGFKSEIAVAKDHNELADQIRSGKLDAAVFHGFEYAWVKQHADLVPLLVTVPNTKHRACLVVNVESKATGAKDLMGESIAIPPATKAHCRLYLERMKETLPEKCCCTAKLDGKSVEEALDAVAADKCPAALVDASALLAYQKDKPAVGKQLKVLCESDPFPGGIVVYRKDAFDAKTATKIREGIIKSTEKPEGRLLTSLWRLKGFAEISPEYQTELDKCLKTFPAPKK
jgi:ABC-type phosphate/phosphonate transport system substrate-binding protein